MATLLYYLDVRSKNKQGLHSLKLAINHKSRTAYLPLNIYLSKAQWDSNAQKVIAHPNKLNINKTLALKKLDIEDYILELNKTKRVSNLTAQELKELIAQKDVETDDTIYFIDCYNKFLSTKIKDNTIACYTTLLTQLKLYNPKIDAISIHDINNDFVRGFIAHLHQHNVHDNTIKNYYARLRAIVNFAYDEKIIDNVTFRTIKLNTSPTKKRSFTIDEFRAIFLTQPTNEKEKYILDIFKLTFYLIGINYVDLISEDTIINRGRVEYIRHKTHKFYSIKLQPEAKEIIDYYHVDKGIFAPYNDDYKTYDNGINFVNKNLKRIFNIDFSMYWTRHTWATLASSLDISKDVIAQALGHTKTVTDIYINFDTSKVDKANRMIIDYLLGK